MRNSLKGHVKSFNDYEDDVARFMNEVALPDCPPPYYALGHSMGGTVLLKAATMRGCWFSRMVLTAPMLEIVGLPMPPAAVSGVTTGLSLCGLGRIAVPGGMRGALSAMAAVNSDRFPDRLRVPVLMLAAGDDRIVSSKAIELFADRLRVGTQILLRGSRHEILQERDLIREQFWAAFDAFVPGAVTSRLGEPIVA
jgi:lysophospholipase